MKLPPNRTLVYLITSGLATDDDIESTRIEIMSTVRTAVECGIPLIQLREKQLSAKNLHLLALDLVEITRDTETLLLINDRADIALAAGADGVHLTSRSLTVERVRAAFGNKLLIGISTHSGEDVKRAAENRADFAVLGPVFETPDKTAALGIEKFREICADCGAFPVIALGGIDQSNHLTVVEAGAAGFAAIRSLNDPVSMLKIMTAFHVAAGD